MAVISVTAASLKKLEALVEELGYGIRYEKGNFKSGSCVLQNGRVVVVNKFLSLEGKINSLIEIIQALPFDSKEVHFDEKQMDLYYSIKQKNLKI